MGRWLCFGDGVDRCYRLSRLSGVLLVRQRRRYTGVPFQIVVLLYSNGFDVIVLNH